MSAGAVIVIRRKKLIRRFREAGATDPEHAVTLTSLGERHNWIFAQMARRGVFLQTHDGRFYLDGPAAEAFLRRQRTRARIAIAIALTLAAWLCAIKFFG